MNKLYNLIAFCILVVVCSCNNAQTDPSITSDGIYAKLETNRGSILLQLAYEKTPITVANFVSLAEGNNKNVSDSLKGKPYFNGIKFHRVIQNFMIQGGDPTATGSGGPGYKFGDEFPKDSVGNLLLKHDKKGILSMANSGKATNGSQFFITHKATPWLDNKHTVFGHVIDGQAIVNTIVKNDVITNVQIIRKGKKAKRFNAPKIFKKGKIQLEEEYNENLAKVEKAAEAKVATFHDLKSKATTLKSGLQIYIDKATDAVKPKKGQQVKIAYAGYFTNGKLFDTNIKSIAKLYETYDFRKDDGGGYKPFLEVYSNAARLIQGFKEGMQLLSVGDKATLFIPSELGYGKSGKRPNIRPNTDLVFEIEITEIVTK